MNKTKRQRQPVIAHSRMIKKGDIHCATKERTVLEASTSEQRVTRQLVELMKRSHLSVDEICDRSYKGQRWLSRMAENGTTERYENPSYAKWKRQLLEALGEE